MDLPGHCCNLLKRNDLETFKGVARLDPQRQVSRTVTVLRVLHFIREQFRLLDEFIDESLAEFRHIQERAGTICNVNDFIEMYAAWERRYHSPLTPTLNAVSKVHATTHRDMGLCLMHLQHPDIRKSRAACDIIRHPRGTLISEEQAMAWLRNIADET